MNPSSGCDGEFRVVIVGGGVAAIEAALCLHELAGDRISITMLAPNDEFVYVPTAVQEPFGRPSAARYPLAQIAQDAGAELCSDTLAWLDSDFFVVHTKHGQQLGFDALLLAPGATVYANFRDAVTVDPHHIADQLQSVLEDIDHGRIHHLAFVIPDGPVWPLPIYELALMTAKRVQEASRQVEITIVTSEPSPLAIFGDAVVEHMRAILARWGITTILSTQSAVRGPGLIALLPAAGVRADRIQPGDEIHPDRIIALPQLFGPHCPGVPTSSRRGFISTDRFGRVQRLDRSFAAGDATDFPIKFGGIAAQQADVAAQSIAALAGADVAPETFRPELRAVLLTGEGSLILSANPIGTTVTHSEVAETDASSPRPKIAARYLTPTFRPSAPRRAHRRRRLTPWARLTGPGVTEMNPGRQAQATEFLIGAEVSCQEGALGELKRLVIDPIDRVITHLVVEAPHRRGSGHLVPLALVVSATAGEIRLACTRADFSQLVEAEEIHFHPGADASWAYDQSQMLSLPYYPSVMGMGGMGPGMAGGTAPEAEILDRIPAGEVEVRRGDRVQATDGPIGHVEGLVIDPGDHCVTYVLLQEGHLWGKRSVSIPIGAVTGIDDDGIRVGLTKQQLKDLPEVPVGDRA